MVQAHNLVLHVLQEVLEELQQDQVQLQLTLAEAVAVQVVLEHLELLLLMNQEHQQSHQASGHCKNNIMQRKTELGLLKYDLSF